MKKQILIITVITLSILSQVFASELNDYLSKGEFDQGVREFSKACSKTTASNQDRFSLAVLLFFDGIEGLAQDFYKYGLDSNTGQRVNLPFLRLPIPKNPNPEKATQKAIYEIFVSFNSSMSAVSSALKDINDSEMNIPIDIASIKIDINGNGQLEDSEYFHTIYSFYNRNSMQLFNENNPVIINFDLGDAYWLKGYSHLLQALTDTLLAYNWSRVYNITSHAFFSLVESDLSPLIKGQRDERYAIWADLIAGVHVMDLPVSDPTRLQRAHEHLIQTINCSRSSWDCIEAEKDNQNEWIPNPNQTGITGAQINQSLINGWKDFLNEFESILKGEKLIPHWRFKNGQGINLRKVFFEPTSFDLLLWIQGAAAIPYLETGEISTRDTWQRITSIFLGNFIGFAIWVN